MCLRVWEADTLSTFKSWLRGAFEKKSWKIFNLNLLKMQQMQNVESWPLLVLTTLVADLQQQTNINELKDIPVIPALFMQL